MTSLPQNSLSDFKAGFKGEVILPGDASYDDVRKIWNAMIDKRPALIARCTDTQDVVRAVNFARENTLTLAVRGGGHNIAGSALCDNGIVVDLSAMKKVAVDTAAGLAHVSGGATLADMDAATQEHGLATPLGINSTTGVAGLTLGGGFGWLSRMFGMTVDNLEAAEVVLADGRVTEASTRQDPDLFWALRGGGGNFGVVTRFTFRIHRVGPDVLSGLVVYPFSEARTVLQNYRRFLETAPNELTVWAVLRQAPPLPFLPPEKHGTEIVAFALLYVGDPKQGEETLAPIRQFGTVLGEHVGVQPYAAWQKTFDPLLAPGSRNYWKSHNFSTLDDGLFDAVISAIGSLPTPQCEIFFGAIGGATTQKSADFTAYAHRDAKFVMNVHGRWEDAADDTRVIKWARDFFAASGPYASGGVYVNFLTADESERVRSAYGANYERLASIKQRYDPANLFCTNQNIRPSKAA